VAIAVEVPEPKRMGRVRLARIADFSADSLVPCSVGHDHLRRRTRTSSAAALTPHHNMLG